MFESIFPVYLMILWWFFRCFQEQRSNSLPWSHPHIEFIVYISSNIISSKNYMNITATTEDKRKLNGFPELCWKRTTWNWKKVYVKHFAFRLAISRGAHHVLTMIWIWNSDFSSIEMWHQLLHLTANAPNGTNLLR